MFNSKNIVIKIFFLFLFLYTNFAYPNFLDSLFQYNWSYKSLQEIVTKNYPLDIKPGAYLNLNLENLQGDITIKGWNQKQVLIEAVKIGADEEIKNTELVVNLDKDILTISTKQNKPKQNIKINYLIMAPEKTNLNISTQIGQISVKLIQGRVSAIVNNGSIKINNSVSSVMAKIDNGLIKLKQKELNSTDAIFLEALSGDINLFLPKKATGTLNAHTGKGKILSDIPVTLNPVNMRLNSDAWEYLKKNINGFLNSSQSGAPINLDTMKGSITIKEI